jgi:hypothetical protein
MGLAIAHADDHDGHDAHGDSHGHDTSAHEPADSAKKVELSTS